MGSSDNDDNSFRPIFLHIDPKHIVQLKFTLESYEGLGIVRTLSAERGEVVVLALEDTIHEVRNILQSISGELPLKEIPPPESIEGDWLFAEEVLGEFMEGRK